VPSSLSLPDPVSVTGTPARYFDPSAGATIVGVGGVLPTEM
jgi:hypothetical protein